MTDTDPEKFEEKRFETIKQERPWIVIRQSEQTPRSFRVGLAETRVSGRMLVYRRKKRDWWWRRKSEEYR